MGVRKDPAHWVLCESNGVRRSSGDLLAFMRAGSARRMKVKASAEEASVEHWAGFTVSRPGAQLTGTGLDSQPRAKHSAKRGVRQ